MQKRSPEEIKDIMNRHNAGETYKEIGDAYGYHPEAVRAIIRREKKAKTKLDVNAKPSVSKTTAQKKDVPEKTDKKEVKTKTVSAKKKTEKKPAVKAAKPIEKKERKENHRTEPVVIHAHFRLPTSRRPRMAYRHGMYVGSRYRVRAGYKIV